MHRRGLTPGRVAADAGAAVAIILGIYMLLFAVLVPLNNSDLNVPPETSDYVGLIAMALVSSGAFLVAAWQLIAFIGPRRLPSWKRWAAILLGFVVGMFSAVGAFANAIAAFSGG